MSSTATTPSRNFALDRVNSAPAVFDPQKFEWLNGQYIHAMSAAELRPLVVNAFIRCAVAGGGDRRREDVRASAAAVQRGAFVS